MSRPERARHRVVRERRWWSIPLRVLAVLAVLAGLLALGYYLAPSLVELWQTVRRSVPWGAPADGDPFSTITMDVRPDP